ncbi:MULTISPECIES: LysR family transcriptional regulator [unclassified Amycolatopsis]|uniref:LysR family transcriptional regulator n=1 Tax=unclassified Amycolatopsis TaxID=2618356 RepID=UPI001C69AD02|nr:LysR family transcriptional regulator [Amycolatopsis sp. DSM 110486]QYN21158.1 LysR family transcriptional regulator [Amycolatopsis sp. DSM 110486]
MNELPDSNPDAVLNTLCPMFVQFAAVAREGQVTKAAAALGVPQPTVTRHLARLENVLGVRLYTRAQGGMTLTADGEQFVKPVQQALAVLTTAIDDLQVRTAHERLRLGFLHTLGEQAVPLLLRRFAEGAPQIKFSLVQDSADQLLRLLREDQVELCLTSPLPALPDIEVARLGQQRLVLAVPATHVLAGESEVPLAAAASDDFVTLGVGNYMRQMAADLCRAAGFEPRIAFEAAGISTLRGLVAAGLGVAIVPAAPAPVPGLVEVPLTDAGAYREVGLAWRVDVELTEPAQRFRSFAVDEFSTALDESTGTSAWQDLTTRGEHDEQSR